MLAMQNYQYFALNIACLPKFRKYNYFFQLELEFNINELKKDRLYGIIILKNQEIYLKIIFQNRIYRNMEDINQLNNNLSIITIGSSLGEDIQNTIKV